MAQGPVLLAPVLNLAFNGREDGRESAFSPVHMRITLSWKADSEISVVRKRMYRTIIKG